MSKVKSNSDVPRAAVHKQILDTAEESPDASMEEIATRVSGTTTDLVERVLKEYGDPAENSDSPGDYHEKSDMSQNSSHQDVDIARTNGKKEQQAETKLTEEQRETVRSIAEHPDASQRELGELLGVSASTISHRLSAIEGFEWENRASFVESLSDGQVANTEEYGQDVREMLDLLVRRVDEVEQQLDTLSTQPESVFADPALVHKVLHACLTSEQVTDEEELRILKEVVVSDPRSDPT